MTRPTNGMYVYVHFLHSKFNVMQCNVMCNVYLDSHTYENLLLEIARSC